MLLNHWLKPNNLNSTPWGEGGSSIRLFIYLCGISCKLPAVAVLLWTVICSECCDQKQHREDSCALSILSCLAVTDAEGDLEGLEGNAYYPCYWLCQINKNTAWTDVKHNKLQFMTSKGALFKMFASAHTWPVTENKKEVKLVLILSPPAKMSSVHMQITVRRR